MKMPSKEGTYRGEIESHAVSATTNGFPQWVVRLNAIEFFDFDSGEYVDCREAQESINAYLVLKNAKGPLLNTEQVMKAVGWDGESYSGLNAMDLAGKVISFRCEENEYKGKINMRVQWVDAADANPTAGALPTLDAAGLADLDAKYNMKKKVTPAKPGSKGATGAKPAAAAKPTAASGAAKKPATTASKSSGGPPTKGPPAASTATVDYTKDSVWETLSTKKGEEVTDDQLAEAWLTAIDVVCNGDGDNATSAQWKAVQNHVAQALDIIPF